MEAKAKTKRRGGRKRSADTSRKEEIAIRMRREGAQWKEIGDALGVEPSSAFCIVQRYLNRVEPLTYERAVAYKQEQIDRLQALVSAMWPRARKGDAACVDRIIKLQERLSRLLGLDAAAPVMIQDADDGGTYVICLSNKPTGAVTSSTVGDVDERIGEADDEIASGEDS